MNDYDALIIGGGAAGLSAALVLLRARRRVAVIDAGHPRNAPASHMHGFLSREGMPPADFLAAGRAEVIAYGGAIIHDTIVALTPGFVADLSDGTSVRGRRVLVTTGLRDRIPLLPGLSERWGRDVLHCPYCHGYEMRDQPLGVLGGDADAIAHAILIRQWSDDVILFVGDTALGDEQRELLDARGVRIQPGEVRGLVIDDDVLTAIELDDGQRIPRRALFVRPVFVANDALLRALGCGVDEAGWIVQRAGGATTVPGVYVAGNAADPRAQIITAAGQGSATAIAINADLVADDLQAALSRARTASPSAPAD